MELSLQRFPTYDQRKISICDQIIDQIIYGENSVAFHFAKGFYYCHEGRITATATGCITLESCTPDEFTCYLINPCFSQDGAKLVGTPLHLENLADYLTSENRQIEIYLELYDFNFLHWRGVLKPYNDSGLSDRIIIELAGDFPITYTWE